MGLRQITLPAGTPTEHLGRSCVRFDEDPFAIVPIGDVKLVDGVLEVEIAVSGERSFPGVAWRIRDDSREEFFIRPHQVGNPDSVQYAPAFNGVSSWQLYHGPGHWAVVAFPIGRWFTMRVCFAGPRGEAYLDDMDEPALVFGRLRAPISAGAIGILPGGSGVHFGRFAYDSSAPTLRGPAPSVDERPAGTVPGWWVSNLVAEGTAPSTARTWTHIDSEPNGLADLARVHPLGTTLNTVFARCTVSAQSDGMRALEFGFSDRAVVYLNGRPIFRGDCTYRSRDYRFLGSIGYWDTVFLPLNAGDNELLIAVSETFGGWGVQARLTDPSGISFS
jgi:hypothetical protein